MARFKAVVTMAVFALLFLFSACSVMPAPGSTVKPPKAVRVDNTNTSADEEIAEKLMPEGASLTSPSNPKGAPALQKPDLDGDGSEELVITYKLGGSEGEKGIVVLKQSAGKWEKIWEQKKQIYGIDRVELHKIPGWKNPLMFVGWATGPSTIRGLDILVWKNGKPSLMYSNQYDRLELKDIEGEDGKKDGKPELLLWDLKPTGKYLVKILGLKEGRVDYSESEYPLFYRVNLDYYNDMVKRSPKSHEYWFLLAYSQLQLDMFDEAAQSLEVAIDKSKRDLDSEFYINLIMSKGEMLLKKKRFSEAEQWFGALLKSIDSPECTINESFKEQLRNATGDGSRLSH